jgi:hypothetical protein
MQTVVAIPLQTVSGWKRQPAAPTIYCILTVELPTPGMTVVVTKQALAVTVLGRLPPAEPDYVTNGSA